MIVTGSPLAGAIEIHTDHLRKDRIMTAVMNDSTSELLSDAFTGRLQELGKAKAAEYRSNSPYPHIVIDNFLPQEVTEMVLREFPDPKQVKWDEFSDKNQVKLAFDIAERLPTPIRQVLYFFNSRPMLQFLEELSGIQGLIPDPYFIGGGLHQIKPGGFLEVHADFNRHMKLKLDRRLNLLLYLNENWKEEYGGHFELWNQDMSASVRQILPLFNRCAIFSTTSTSYHGHPNPLTCPPNRTRKSVAIYYYSNGRPEEEVREGHDTLFRGAEPVSKSHFSVKNVIRSITPPILMDAVTRSKRP
jgi:Rps23 Pro-64 3,4-dihydroxylase Tpa1-like proline 4-hydroxylase